MPLFRRRARRADPYAAVSDEERISRYVYLLSTLPPSVIEHAHAAAFADLPPEKRRAMFDELRPFMSEEEQRADAEPSLLARVLTRVTGEGGTTVLERTDAPARRRDDAPFLFADPSLSVAIAYSFLVSGTVTSYFAFGAGSIGLAGEPAWVGEIGGVGSGGDAGFGGYDGGGSDGGGGFDGGGFGGFDGGGFGGGDGGGG